MQLDRKAYGEQMRDLARAAFAEHINATMSCCAKSRGIDGGALGWHAGRVCIRRSGSLDYAVELVWLRFGRLLVHGDIEPVVIAAPDATMRDAVHRLANSHISYVADKVAEGSWRCDGGRCVDRDVFFADLLQARRNCYSEDGRKRRLVAPMVIDALNRSIEDARHSAEPEVIKHNLRLAGLGPEILQGLGSVVAVPVWYAHSALKKVNEMHGGGCE